MASVPRTPSQFFLDFVPAAFSRGAATNSSSTFSVSFEVSGEGVFSLRLKEGRIEASQGEAPDVLLRIALEPGSFQAIVLPMAERAVATPAAEPELMALRALTLDADRERLLRESRGEMVLRVTDAEAEHRIRMSAGASPTPGSSPECEVSCSLDDLWALQSGKSNPIELLMNGKIRITGDAQLALSLSAALG